MFCQKMYIDFKYFYLLCSHITFTMKLSLIFLGSACLLFSGCAMRTVTGRIPVSGNAFIYYEECGKGEPLILLHGHSLDCRMWDGQFKAFAKKYRTIRMDFRGYGKSSKQTETFQFTHADDVITLMDSLKIAKADVVGLSMGSFVCGDLLGVYPERMTSCVLASGGIKSKQKGPSQPMDSVERRKRDNEIEALKRKGVDTMKREWLDALVLSGGTKRESIRKPLKEMIDDWDAWQPLHKEVRLIVASDAYRLLKEKRPLLPVLMINGTTPEHPNTARPEMLNYLPNGKYVLIKDCGHMLNMERPKEFNKVVLDFLETVHNDSDTTNR